MIFMAFCPGRRAQIIVACIGVLSVHAVRCAAARAATWRVGPDEAMHAPSEAARQAADGDSVVIDPGTYYDCAVWRQAHLSLRAAGPGVVLTDTTCVGKAIWVIDGAGAQIDGITFARARVPDLNGAGIRAEAPDVRVAHARFINNEVGILDTATGGTLRVSDSDFDGNGRALLIGPSARLEIGATRITGTHAGDAIASAAALTAINGGAIRDGDEGAAGCLISTTGDLDLRGVAFRKAATGANPGCVVLADGAAKQVTVHGGAVAVAPPGAATFIRNASGANVSIDGVSYSGDVAPERGPSLRMVAGRLLGAAKDAARAARSAAKTAARDALNIVGVPR